MQFFVACRTCLDGFKGVLKMIKRILTISLVIAICIFASISVSAYTEQYVFDYSDSLSYGEIQELESLAGQLEYEYDCCVMFCITSEQASEGYALNLYDTYTDNKNGIVLVHDIEEKMYYYYVTDDAKSQFGANEIAGLQDAYDSNDSYFGGIEAYYGLAESLLDSGATVALPDEDSYATGDGLVDRTQNTAKVIVGCIVAGMVAGFLIIFAIASKNKSVKMQENATVYTRPGSFVVRDSYDNFLYKKLDKTPKPKQNNKG